MSKLVLKLSVSWFLAWFLNLYTRLILTVRISKPPNSLMYHLLHLWGAFLKSDLVQGSHRIWSMTLVEFFSPANNSRSLNCAKKKKKPAETNEDHLKTMQPLSTFKHILHIGQNHSSFTLQKDFHKHIICASDLIWKRYFKMLWNGNTGLIKATVSISPK